MLSARFYWVIQPWYYTVLLTDKILKEQNTNRNKLLFVYIFALSAGHNKEINISAKVAENNSVAVATP